MPLIPGAIGQVVEKVDDARERAEDGERRDRPSDRLDVEQPSAEQHAREDEQILRPLFRAQRDQKEPERG